LISLVIQRRNTPLTYQHFDVQFTVDKTIVIGK
jgi:hypothetical protein